MAAQPKHSIWDEMKSFAWKKVKEALNSKATVGYYSLFIGLFVTTVFSNFSITSLPIPVIQLVTLSLGYIFLVILNYLFNLFTEKLCKPDFISSKLLFHHLLENERRKCITPKSPSRLIEGLKQRTDSKWRLEILRNGYIDDNLTKNFYEERFLKKLLPHYQSRKVIKLFGQNKAELHDAARHLVNIIKIHKCIEEEKEWCYYEVRLPSNQPFSNALLEAEMARVLPLSRQTTKNNLSDILQKKCYFIIYVDYDFFNINQFEDTIRNAEKEFREVYNGDFPSQTARLIFSIYLNNVNTDIEMSSSDNFTVKYDLNYPTKNNLEREYLGAVNSIKLVSGLDITIINTPRFRDWYQIVPNINRKSKLENFLEKLRVKVNEVGHDSRTKEFNRLLFDNRYEYFSHGAKLILHILQECQRLDVRFYQHYITTIVEKQNQVVKTNYSALVEEEVRKELSKYIEIKRETFQGNVVETWHNMADLENLIKTVKLEEELYGQVVKICLKLALEDVELRFKDIKSVCNRENLAHIRKLIEGVCKFSLCISDYSYVKRVVSIYLKPESLLERYFVSLHESLQTNQEPNLEQFLDSCFNNKRGQAYEEQSDDDFDFYFSICSFYFKLIARSKPLAKNDEINSFAIKIFENFRRYIRSARVLKKQLSEVNIYMQIQELQKILNNQQLFEHFLEWVRTDDEAKQEYLSWEIIFIKMRDAKSTESHRGDYGSYSNAYEILIKLIQSSRSTNFKLSDIIVNSDERQKFLLQAVQFIETAPISYEIKLELSKFVIKSLDPHGCSTIIINSPNLLEVFINWIDTMETDDLISLATRFSKNPFDFQSNSNYSEAEIFVYHAIYAKMLKRMFDDQKLHKNLRNIFHQRILAEREANDYASEEQYIIWLEQGLRFAHNLPLDPDTNDFLKERLYGSDLPTIEKTLFDIIIHCLLYIGFTKETYNRYSWASAYYLAYNYRESYTEIDISENLKLLREKFVEIVQTKFGEPNVKTTALIARLEKGEEEMKRRMANPQELIHIKKNFWDAEVPKLGEYHERNITFKYLKKMFPD